MRRNSKIISQSKKSSTTRQIINCTTLLGYVISLFLIPNIHVSAETSAQEEQYISYYSYLPIALSGDPVYYVSPEGDDGNPGTFSLPWRTIRKSAEMVEPGDTVYIRGGTYNESVHFTTSGTASSPIRILAYPGENPIVDGENTIPGVGSALIWIVGDYIHASGIEVRNSAYYGILVLGNYDVVGNMYVHHCQTAGIVISQGHHSMVEYSRVWWNSIVNEYGHGASWGAGITAIKDGVSYATVRNNVVWENWGEGITSSVADNTIIENNISHDNFSANIYITDSTNVLCQRNFVYTDPTSSVFPYGTHSGIMMGDERYTPPSANIKIINNISYGNLGNFWWWQGTQGGGMDNVLIANNTFVNGIGDPSQGRGGVIISLGTHQNVRFENNLVQQDGDLPVIATVDQPGVMYSHNLWSKPPYPTAQGPGDIIGDPRFAQIGDPFSPDWFKLTGLSPAIGQALSIPEVFVDYFGITRDMPPDMGANEFFSNP